MKNQMLYHNLLLKFSLPKYLSDVVLNNNLKLTSFLIRSGLLLYYITRRGDHYPTTHLLSSNKNSIFGEEVKEHYARACCHIESSLLVPE